MRFEYDFYCEHVDETKLKAVIDDGEEIFNRYPTRPNAAHTWFYGARPHTFEARAEFETKAEAYDAVNLFPRSLRMKAGVSIAADGSHKGFLAIRVKFGADAANKGTNEAGIARVNTFRRNCERLGFELVKTSAYGNSSYRDLAGFDFMLKGGKA